jgi:DNA-binding transcriptional regulator WhiA
MGKINIGELDNICKLYFDDKLSTIKIGELYDVNHNTVYRFLKRHGKIPRKMNEYIRKYTITDDYFKSIDSFDKAYFLGFLYADGSLNLQNYSVSLSLASKDLEILKLFKKYTKFSGNVVTRASKNKKHSDVSTVVIYNQDFYNNALLTGLTPRKSLTISFPTIEVLPKELYWHFIRGYFDGDGCICRTSQNKLSFSVLGTNKLLLKITEIFESVGISKRNIYQKGKENVFYFSTSKKRDLQLIGKYMYDNKSDCFLQRKYDKFIL